MSIIWIGAIGGSLIGILGGVFGTYCSIRNTQGPRERAFMIKAAICCWILVTAFLAGLFLIPKPYNLLLWVVYPILLTAGIMWCNKNQDRIRMEEAGQAG
ncbi:MAG: hypothetical protein WD065_15015 [Planctomycetaceae bacterium]